LPSLNVKKSIKLPGPGGTVVGLARGGRAILFHEQNGTLSLVDPETGSITKLGTALPAAPGYTNIQISADGTVAVQLAPGGSVWDLVGQKPPVPLENFTPQSMRGCVSGDGRVVVAWDFNTKGPRVWDTTTGKDRRLPIKVTDPYTSTLAVSPDGKSFAAVTLSSVAPPIRYKLQVWDAATGQVRAAKETGTDAIANLRFLPDGTLLVASQQAGASVWDPAGGKERPLKGNPAAWAKWEASADGKLLASCDFQGQLSVWNLVDGSLLHQIAMPGPVISMNFAPDGRHLTTTNGNGSMYILRLSGPS
jgi:WD40 repeat protein